MFQTLWNIVEHISLFFRRIRVQILSSIPAELSLLPVSTGFLLGLVLGQGDLRNMFLQNVGVSPKYEAL
jgi:hypothetical protein